MITTKEWNQPIQRLIASKQKRRKKSFTSKSRWFVQQYQAKLIHWIKLNAKCELHNKKTKTKPKFISRAKAMHIFIWIDGGRTFIEIIPHAFYAFSEEFLSCCFRCTSLYGRWLGAACLALLYGKELYPDLMKWNFNRLWFFFSTKKMCRNETSWPFFFGNKIKKSFFFLFIFT